MVLLTSGPATVTTGPVTPGGHPAGAVTQRGNTLTLTERTNPATKAHSLLVDWSDLQPTSATATTNSFWTQLAATCAAADATPTLLILRILAGIGGTPTWVYTHPTRPVPWVDCKATGTRPVQGTTTVGAAPDFSTSVSGVQGQYPLALQWDLGVAASPTVPQIQAAVTASAYRWHWLNFLNNMLVPFLAAPCSGGGAAHTRGSHILCVPATAPSMFGSEMTTSDNNNVNGYLLSGTVHGGKSTMLVNGSRISGTTNLVTAYEWLWTLAVQDLVAALPANIYVNLMGGMVFGDVDMQMRLLKSVCVAAAGRAVIGRTDFRESYFDGAGTQGAFGGGLIVSSSPIRLLTTAVSLGVPYCIQTAGDSLFFDWAPSRTGTVDHAVVAWQRFLSYCPYPLFVEPSTSWADMSGSAGVFRGEVMATLPHSGAGPFDTVAARWAGGVSVSLAGYLTTGPNNLQAQIA